MKPETPLHAFSPAIVRFAFANARVPGAAFDGGLLTVHPQT